MLRKVLTKPILLSFVLPVLVANSVYAAKMISYCSMDHSTKEIKGANINIKYPIASVSKLFTSLMATTTFNLDTTFSTVVYATPANKTSHDVHIVGSADPYFNRFKMQMIVSRLNEAGVKNIRYMTFDENVKYLHDTDAYKGFSVTTGSRKIKLKDGTSKWVPVKTYIRPTLLKADMSYPDKNLVEAQLKEQRVIMADYSKTYLAAKAAGIELYKSPRFSVVKTSFKSANDFTPATNSIKLYVTSQDMRSIVKSMNWNSNNFSSNRLLVATGGLERLNDFYFNTLKVSPAEFRFVNGSGQNHDLNGGGRLYNEASCSVVVRTIRALKISAENQSKRLQDLVAVMGVDKGSTVGGAAYTKPETKGKVAAKTGTVGTNITLGGMINAALGPQYFFFNVELANASKREENRARAMINVELAKLVKKHGAVAFNYQMDNPLKDNMDNYDEDEEVETDEEKLAADLIATTQVEAEAAAISAPTTN